MSDFAFQTVSSSTVDTPKAALLRLARDGDGFIVDDLIGLQYGWGETEELALTAWAVAVREHIEFVDANLCAPNLVNEALRYKQALNGGLVGESEQ